MAIQERSYDEIIEKIFELSKNKKIIWQYLDANESLCQNLKIIPKKTQLNATISWDIVTDNLAGALYPQSLFDANQSFYSSIGENYIIILCKLNRNEEKELIADKTKLMLVPRTFKNIEVIEETDKMLRLRNFIKKQFPDVQDIIDDIFAM